jgi:hypothetical protein
MTVMAMSVSLRAIVALRIPPALLQLPDDLSFSFIKSPFVFFCLWCIIYIGCRMSCDIYHKDSELYFLKTGILIAELTIRISNFFSQESCIQIAFSANLHPIKRFLASFGKHLFLIMALAWDRT